MSLLCPIKRKMHLLTSSNILITPLKLFVFPQKIRWGGGYYFVPFLAFFPLIFDIFMFSNLLIFSINLFFMHPLLSKWFNNFPGTFLYIITQNIHFSSAMEWGEVRRASSSQVLNIRNNQWKSIRIEHNLWIFPYMKVKDKKVTLIDTIQSFVLEILILSNES